MWSKRIEDLLRWRGDNIEKSNTLRIEVVLRQNSLLGAQTKNV